jgi:hypothetical protein
MTCDLHLTCTMHRPCIRRAESSPKGNYFFVDYGPPVWFRHCQPIG